MQAQLASMATGSCSGWEFMSFSFLTLLFGQRHYIYFINLVYNSEMNKMRWTCLVQGVTFTQDLFGTGYHVDSGPIWYMVSRSPYGGLVWYRLSSSLWTCLVQGMLVTLDLFGTGYHIHSEVYVWILCRYRAVSPCAGAQWRSSVSAVVIFSAVLLSVLPYRLGKINNQDRTDRTTM